MKIALGSDHAGFLYKEKVKALLLSLGHEVKDCGTDSEKPVPYPAYIRPAAQAVASGECERGIVFGGSGNGEAMVANKVKGVRCAYVWNSQTAQLGRKHNDANVISFGQRMISEYIMLECVQIFLDTPFEGGRHVDRVREIESPLSLCYSALMADYTLLKSKLHRATVTGASLHYEGSLTVAEDLAKKAGFLPYEKILVGNINNGERFETYMIYGRAGTKVIELNGATAHLGKIGDRLTIMSFAQVPAELAQKHQPTVVRLDEKNDVLL